MAEETENMFSSWDHKPLYAKKAEKAEKDVNGNSLELTITDDVVTAIGGKAVGGGSDIPDEGTTGQVLTKTEEGYDWEDPLQYTTKDVYDAEVYGGIVIETRGNTKVAILNENTEYVPPVTATVQSVELNRNFTPNVMSTVWFPFSFKASELANARIYKLNSLTYDPETGKYIMGEDDITELTGDDAVAECTPYMISVSTQKLQFNFTGNVEINTNEFHSYFVTFNAATRGSTPGGTFTPVDARISRFGDLPGWNSNRYYGFSGISSGSSIEIGDFVSIAETAWVSLFRAYFVRPND